MTERLSSVEIKKKKIGVLRGGLSSEREISLKTGKAILEVLLQKEYCAIGIEADRSLAAALLREKIEVAFIALHGPWGEDGTVQGLLEMMGIPYTGSGVLGSALAMNKLMAKKLFSYHHLPTPAFEVVSASGSSGEISLALPLVVKPASGGSSIGTSIVFSREKLESALRSAAQEDEKILVEAYVDGVDITVGVLNGKPLPVIEIRPREGFYDYTNKYNPGKTEYLVPAPIPAQTAQQAQAFAVTAFHGLQCAGAARVDFRLGRDGSLMILEVNTIPGFTETSLLPMAAAAAGISFPDLTEQILLSARLHVHARGGSGI